jgi:transposase InsO family protein
MNTLQQQEKFDHFVDEFNRERPHEALDMKRPADVYVASKRAYAAMPPLLVP